MNKKKYLIKRTINLFEKLNDTFQKEWKMVHTHFIEVFDIKNDDENSSSNNSDSRCHQKNVECKILN